MIWKLSKNSYYLYYLKGYKAYLGMLEVEIYHTHPLLKAFIMILQEQVHDTKTRSSSTDGHVNIGCKSKFLFIPAFTRSQGLLAHLRYLRFAQTDEETEVRQK